MNGTQRVFEEREREREQAHGGDDRGKRERTRAEHLPHHDADRGLGRLLQKPSSDEAAPARSGNGVSAPAMDCGMASPRPQR